MCGLFGAFRADNALFDHKIIDLMEHGLYVNALRGTDGTGIGLVESNFAASFSKSHLASPDFLQTRHWAWAKKFMVQSRACLGHTRHSTNQNSYNTEGAHPFVWEIENDKKQMEAVMLTHNGHCSKAFRLTPTDFNHPVDSAHIAYALLMAGENKVENVLAELDGFYVLVWYNQLAKTMNICRNDGTRELYMVANKAKTQIYYSSEQEMIKFALDRVGVEVDKNYRELKPFIHYTWDLTKNSLDKPLARKYEEKKAYQGYQGGSGKAGTHGSRTTGANTGSDPLAEDSAVKINPLHPLKGDIIYGDFSFVAGSRGSFHHGTNKNGEQTIYGYIYGTRKLDQDSSIKLVGINKEDLVHYKDLIEELPCKVLRVEIVKQTTTNREILSYEVCLDRTRAQTQLNNKKYWHPTVNLVPGWAGQISLWKWKDLQKEGCAECDGAILDTDVGHVGFMTHPLNPEDLPTDVQRQMVCPTCCKELTLQIAAERNITLPQDIAEKLENEEEEKIVLPDAPDKGEDEDFVPGPLDSAEIN